MIDHEKYMKIALSLADCAKENDNVPVGAIVVLDSVVIGIGFNTRDSKSDIFGHAEMHALKQAALSLGTWRLDGCTLYSTLEPCPMCSGAALQARIEKIVFGAYDKNAGCCGTLYNLPNDDRFNHKIEVLGGIMHEECAQLLKDFFKDKREENRDFY